MPTCKATEQVCDPKSKYCKNSRKHMFTINRMCPNLVDEIEIKNKEGNK